MRVRLDHQVPVGRKVSQIRMTTQQSNRVVGENLLSQCYRISQLVQDNRDLPVLRLIQTGIEARSRPSLSLMPWDLPSAPIILPVIGGLFCRRSSTYPTYATSSFCSLLMVCVPTQSVGS